MLNNKELYGSNSSLYASAEGTSSGTHYDMGASAQYGQQSRGNNVYAAVSDTVIQVDGDTNLYEVATEAP